MTERRSLTEGLKTVTLASNTDQEVDFVYGRQRPTSESPTKASSEVARVPVSTRIRDDLAKALKRASLERQLKGLHPNTLQDILEEAIEPWLRTHGYID